MAQVLVDMDNFQVAGYPVEWENQDGNLVVTITLDSLPPEPDWVSENDDVVLVRNADSDGPVWVTWTATAATYGTVFRGETNVTASAPFGLAGNEQDAGERSP